jgi:hypothetical protein
MYREWRMYNHVSYYNSTGDVVMVRKAVHEYNDESFVYYACLGAEMFGLWTVEFRYDIFNPDTGRTEPRIVAYPRTFFIQPRRQTFIRDVLVAVLPTFAHSVIRSVLPADDEKPFNSSELVGVDLQGLPSAKEIKLTRLLADSELHLLHTVENIALGLLDLMLMVVVLLVLTFLLVVLDRYFRRVKRTYLRPVPPEELAEQQCLKYPHWAPPEQNYDVFVSANEEDGLELSRDVVEFAEQHKLRVFFPP